MVEDCGGCGGVATIGIEEGRGARGTAGVGAGCTRRGEGVTEAGGE